MLEERLNLPRGSLDESAARKDDPSNRFRLGKRGEWKEFFGNAHPQDAHQLLPEVLNYLDSGYRSDRRAD